MSLFCLKILDDATPSAWNTFSLIPYPKPHCHCSMQWNSVHYGNLSSATTSARKPSLISFGQSGLDTCFISFHSILFLLLLQLLAYYVIKLHIYLSVCEIRPLALSQVGLSGSPLYLQCLDYTWHVYGMNKSTHQWKDGSEWNIWYDGPGCERLRLS